MSTTYNSNLRTARSQMAKLMASLYDPGQTTFTTADGVRITGVKPPLTQFNAWVHVELRPMMASQINNLTELRMLIENLDDPAPA